MSFKFKRFATLVAAATVVASSQANPVNTYAGPTIPANNTPDTNWFWQSGPYNAGWTPTQNAVTYKHTNYHNPQTYSGGVPLGGANWISNSASGNAPANTAFWFWQTFTISTGTFISVNWSTDNESDLYLFNGNGLDVLSNATQSSLGAPSNFDSGHTTKDFGLLGAGTYTVLFHVNNAGGSSGNPVGLIAKFSTTPVPEPFTMALGAAGIGLAVRRRMKKTA